MPRAANMILSKQSFITQRVVNNILDAIQERYQRELPATGTYNLKTHILSKELFFIRDYLQNILEIDVHLMQAQYYTERLGLVTSYYIEIP